MTELTDQELIERLRAMSGEDEMIHTIPWPNIKRALSLAADRLEAQGWKPIESAPKDGTPILAYCVHPNARYAGENFEEWTEIVTTRWIDHNGGGWTWNGLCGVHTHWRPLPAPPSEEA